MFLPQKFYSGFNELSLFDSHYLFKKSLLAWVGDKGKEQLVHHYRLCVDSYVWSPDWENILADRF